MTGQGQSSRCVATFCLRQGRGAGVLGCSGRSGRNREVAWWCECWPTPLTPSLAVISFLRCCHAPCSSQAAWGTLMGTPRPPAAPWSGLGHRTGHGGAGHRPRRPISLALPLSPGASTQPASGGNVRLMQL